MCMTLGGRAAEALTFKKITTGEILWYIVTVCGDVSASTLAFGSGHCVLSRVTPFGLVFI